MRNSRDKKYHEETVSSYTDNTSVLSDVQISDAAFEWKDKMKIFTLGEC